MIRVNSLRVYDANGITKLDFDLASTIDRIFGNYA